jgi:ABC-type phosphate transport system substrate-binding protein
MKKCFLAGIVAAAGIVISIPVHAELIIIVNPKNPAASLSAEQVAQLFLGKSGTFPGGAAATPINLAEGVPLRDEFYTKVADKNPGQVKAYWAKQMFSGKGSPPKELPTSSDVKKAVASDPGAIGYVEKSALDATVKGVLTIQ